MYRLPLPCWRLSICAAAMLAGLAIDDSRLLSSSGRWCTAAPTSLLQRAALHYTLFPTMFLMMPGGALLAFVGELVMRGRTRPQRTGHHLLEHLCCFAMMSGGMLVFLPIEPLGNALGLPHTSAMAMTMLIGMIVGAICEGFLFSIITPIFSLHDADNRTTRRIVCRQFKPQ